MEGAREGAAMAGGLAVRPAGAKLHTVGGAAKLAVEAAMVVGAVVWDGAEMADEAALAGGAMMTGGIVRSTVGWGGGLPLLGNARAERSKKFY